MRLGDLDALLESAGVFEVEACARGCGKSTLRLAKAWLWNEVQKAPTIDAVPVVRCKDCKHMDIEPYGRYCHVWGFFNGAGDEGFCNYGERKDGEG